MKKHGVVKVLLSISLLLLEVAVEQAFALRSTSGATRPTSESSRSAFVAQATGAAVALVFPALTNAVDTSSSNSKRVGISDEDLRKVVLNDMVENQFLATGRLTREVYDESATFTDEIDTYTLDKWVVGTQRLFNGENSEVRLDGDVNVSASEVMLRFDEDLQFNIPFRPTVRVTGKLVLSRDPSSGLITSYREFWDDDVAGVLKTAKFKFGKE
mmetsp:Transcript_4066/g.5601  ORF Transcript_4066/g.5601 Transcript_4066/m.5601 type:complete len:214 (+) Transcript_4066:89-730(+)